MIPPDITPHPVTGIRVVPALELQRSSSNYFSLFDDEPHHLVIVPDGAEASPVKWCPSANDLPQRNFFSFQVTPFRMQPDEKVFVFTRRFAEAADRLNLPVPFSLTKLDYYCGMKVSEPDRLFSFVSTAVTMEEFVSGIENFIGKTVRDVYNISATLRVEKAQELLHCGLLDGDIISAELLNCLASVAVGETATPFNSWKRRKMVNLGWVNWR